MFINNPPFSLLMWEEFVEKYNALRAKNKDLPSIEELDSDYELKMYINEKKDPPSFIIRNVRRAMSSYICSWINICHGYIIPNQGSGISIEEMKHFDVDEKREIALYIDKLMYISRSSSLMELEQNDKKDAAWVIEIHKLWQGIKSELIKKISKNVMKWKFNFEKK